jgi:PKD repeat protein
MIAALTSPVAQRSSLWQTANLNQTGVSIPPELCAAELVANDRELCAGGSVVFTDVSYNNVTSRTWSFPGGSPATSTDPQVVVTYNEPGVFPVTLSVSDGVNSLQRNEESFIVVLPDTGAAWPASEGFESIASLNGGAWWSVSEEGPSFVLSTSAAYSGSRSVQLPNTGLTVGHVDELISSTYDASGVSALQVSFRYAFARRQSSNTDVLRLFTSNNCGTNWVPRKTLRADTDLPTAPNQSGTFVPSSASEWGYAEVNGFGAVNFVPNLRLKFQFTGGGGNALYLDDININGVPVVTSVVELVSGPSTFVHPNPSTGDLQLVLDEDWQGPVTMEVYDPLGRTLDRKVLNGAGARTLPMVISNGHTGVHLIRLSDGSRSLTLRAMVVSD